MFLEQTVEKALYGLQNGHRGQRHARLHVSEVLLNRLPDVVADAEVHQVCKQTYQVLYFDFTCKIGKKRNGNKTK